MEQQKILWITLSIAVLLLVVLASTLFVFGSSSNSAQAARVSDVRSDRGFDPIEWARTGSEYPTLNDSALQNNNDGSFVVSGGNAISLSPDQSVVIASDTTESPGNIVSLPVKRIEQPQPRTPSVAPAAPTPSVAPAVSVAPAAAPAVPSAPVRTSESAPRPAPAPAAPVASAAPAPRITTVKEYWIQTNSFSTVARAEEERRIITSKGFPAIIQTRIIGDDTFYRVRVGAYSSRAEAEKFLLWIKNSGFESSQIFEVTARREI